MDGKVVNRSNVSGLGLIWKTYVTVTVEEGYRIADVEILTDWLIWLGWATRDHPMNIDMFIAVSFEGETDGNDWGGLQAARELGYSVASDPAPQNGMVVLSREELAQKLGAWPGQPPEIPEGLLTKNEPGAG